MSAGAAWTFELVAGPFGFTEGPVWDGSGVLFASMPSSRIMRYDAETGEVRVLAEGTNGANGLALDAEGRLYVCESNAGRVMRYDQDGSRGVLADRFEGKRLNSPNDVVVDSRGSVWFTDPRYGDRSIMELDHDSVYRLDPGEDGEHRITRVTFDTTRPNGLVFSADESTLYVAESPPAPDGVRQLRAYPVLRDRSLGTMQVLHEFGPNRGIDGMCLDEAGRIVAAAGWAEGGPGSRIAVFESDGSVLAIHPTPAEPTNCCFGGEDLTVLFVTAKDGALYWAKSDLRSRESVASIRRKPET